MCLFAFQNLDQLALHLHYPFLEIEGFLQLVDPFQQLCDPSLKTGVFGHQPLRLHLVVVEMCRKLVGGCYKNIVGNNVGCDVNREMGHCHGDSGDEVNAEPALGE